MVAIGHLVHKYDEIICSIHQGGHPASHHEHLRFRVYYYLVEITAAASKATEEEEDAMDRKEERLRMVPPYHPFDFAPLIIIEFQFWHFLWTGSLVASSKCK
jgi:hypothetical protein